MSGRVGELVLPHGKSQISCDDEERPSDFNIEEVPLNQDLERIKIMKMINNYLTWSELKDCIEKIMIQDPSSIIKIRTIIDEKTRKSKASDLGFCASTSDFKYLHGPSMSEIPDFKLFLATAEKGNLNSE